MSAFAGKQPLANVCFILKADVQVEVMIGSFRPKADIKFQVENVICP